MVPFSLSIWYHILHQNGTIFYFNMVPYSFRVSLVLKNSITKIHFQNNPFLSSKCVLLHELTDKCLPLTRGGPCPHGKRYACLYEPGVARRLPPAMFWPPLQGFARCRLSPAYMNRGCPGTYAHGRICPLRFTRSPWL